MPWMRIVTAEGDTESTRKYLHRHFTLGAVPLHREAMDVGVFIKGQMIYLSPKAVEIAGDLLSRFKAVECKAPSREGLTAIHVADWDSIPFAQE